LSNQVILSVEPGAFGSLSEADRYALRRWVNATRAIGIDDVRDLTARPWPSPVTGAVIGVFMRGDEHASWLAVEQNGSWAVACCVDGSVSESVDSLEDALDIVYRAGGTSGCS
jgi:hypothetical protein